MRILYVVDEFPTVSETFVLAEVGELLRRGDEVRLVSRRRPQKSQPLHGGAEEIVAATRYLPKFVLGAAIALLVRNPRRSIRALWWCVCAAPLERGALRVFGEAAHVRAHAEPVDHVHAHFAHGSASLALVVAQLNGCSFSFTAHAHDVFVASRPILLRRKVSQAAAVVTPAEFMQRRVRQLARDSDAEKVVVVRNGIDLHRFTRASSTTSPPVILAVARLVEKKGLDTAIHACGLLTERGLRVRLDIVGEGPLRPLLQQLAEEAGGHDVVRLLGAQPQETVQALLSAASVFVLPCRVARNGDCDTLPVALVEALAAGLPVVTTDVGGIPELIADRRSGMVVRPDDPVATAHAVEEVLRDASLRERIVSGGREVAGSYDLETTVDHLRHLFVLAAGSG